MPDQPSKANTLLTFDGPVPHLLYQQGSVPLCGEAPLVNGLAQGSRVQKDLYVYIQEHDFL